MGIRIGTYILEANAATNVAAFCMEEAAASPKSGIGYQSIGYGANNAYVVTSKGRYSIKEALDKGFIEITGASDEYGAGLHDRLQFKNNTNEKLRFEVTDDLILKTGKDSYQHVPGILNRYQDQFEIWDALEESHKNQALREVNENSPNRLLVVTYENNGSAIKYIIDNGQNEPIYSGNNFREIAAITNNASNSKQYFVLKDFPTEDRKMAFLRSVELANQNITGYRAVKFAEDNLTLAKALIHENPRLVRTNSVELGTRYDYRISADVEIDHVEYEVAAEADKQSLLNTWKNRIANLFGIRSNNLNDILIGADRTIRQTFPDDDYGVMVNNYYFSFVKKEKQSSNPVIAKR
jgi:hypothetical protein